VLILGLGVLVASGLEGQVFTTLHDFTDESDGGSPIAGLALSGNTLYGTVINGGAYSGTVFKLNTDGTGFTVLHTFQELPFRASTNWDGARPYGDLLLVGNTLYGTAGNGGTNGNGTIFTINTDGTGFAILHSFGQLSGSNGPAVLATNWDGANPHAGLVLSGDTLYGTAPAGGSSGFGTLFALNTNGTGFTIIHSFAGYSGEGSPTGRLALSTNILYGGAGILVFAVETNGNDFRTVYRFSGGSDGAAPEAGLTLAGDTLYGEVVRSGVSGVGGIFKVNTDGTGFTTLHNFMLEPTDTLTNSDGAFLYGGVILSSGWLYGTAASGGIWGNGTVFALKTDGTEFTTLYNFTAADPNTNTNSDGGTPFAGVVLLLNTLYSTAVHGGSSGQGTVFSLSFQPRLTIAQGSGNITLRWPTNYAGFDYTGYRLQSTTNLALPLWTTNPPAPVVVNGQNTVTGPISGTQQFFRLSQ